MIHSRPLHSGYCADKIKFGAVPANPAPAASTDAPTVPAKAEKAHLAESSDFPGQWLAQDVALTSHTAHQISKGNLTTDYRLATSDDTLRKGGGLLLATMAGLGTGSLTLASKELLGLVAWFGVGMSVAPLLINLAFQRTGVDFGQHYITSYNQGEERQKLFINPEYLPTHLIPDEQRQSLMEYAHINPNQDKDILEDKLKDEVRKRTVQRNTLWMLTAGPLTAVATALACHSVEPLLEKAVPRVLQWGDQTLLALAQWTSKPTSQLGLSQWTGHQQHLAIAGLSNAIAGKQADSRIAQWWGDFSKEIPQKLGLDAVALPVQDILKPGQQAMPDRGKRLDALVERFITLSGDQRQQAGEYLTQQAEHLTKLGATYAQQVDPAETKVRQQFIRTLERELPQHLDDELSERLMDLNPRKTLDTLQQVKQWASADLPAKNLATFTKALDDVAGIAEQRQQVTARLLDGLNTLAQYESGLARGATQAQDWVTLAPDQQGQVRHELSQWLTANTGSTIGQLRKGLHLQPLADIVNPGMTEQRRQVLLTVGHEVAPDMSRHLLGLMDNEQVMTVGDSLGSSPLAHLDQAVRQQVLRNTWRTNMARVAGGLGVGTVASAIALTQPSDSAINQRPQFQDNAAALDLVAPPQKQSAQMAAPPKAQSLVPNVALSSPLQAGVSA